MFLKVYQNKQTPYKCQFSLLLHRGSRMGIQVVKGEESDEEGNFSLRFLDLTLRVQTVHHTCNAPFSFLFPVMTPCTRIQAQDGTLELLQ